MSHMHLAIVGAAALGLALFGQVAVASAGLAGATPGSDKTPAAGLILVRGGGGGGAGNGGASGGVVPDTGFSSGASDYGYSTRASHRHRHQAPRYRNDRY